MFTEAPRAIGKETEFFIQRDPAEKIACSPHVHSAIEILYIIEGSYSVLLDNTPYELEKGDLILFRSDAVHYVTTKTEAHNSYYVIKIPLSFFLNLARGETEIKYAMHFAFNRKEYKCLWKNREIEGSEMFSIISALKKEYASPGYASELLIKLKIMELMTEILRQCRIEDTSIDNRSASMVYSIMSYVQENYAEDIDEKELSRKFGMSYSYFSRTFKRITGSGFKNYLNRIRISNAERMLFSTGKSVSEIATACGYNSISYFISVYRSMMGITPYKALTRSVSSAEEKPY